MPREDRRIIFTYEETYKAIYALSAQKSLPKPPPAQITGLSESPDDPRKIVITMENPQEKWDAKREIEYSRDFIAAALMLMCRGVGIPLPKSARKSVLIEPEQTILRVEI